jgi:hypothetical protein
MIHTTINTMTPIGMYVNRAIVNVCLELFQISSCSLFFDKHPNHSAFIQMIV